MSIENPLAARSWTSIHPSLIKSGEGWDSRLIGWLIANQITYIRRKEMFFVSDNDLNRKGKSRDFYDLVNEELHCGKKQF